MTTLHPRITAHRLQRWQEALWLLIALLTPLFVNLWVEQQFEASKVWLLRTLVWVLSLLWLHSWMNGFQPKQLSSSIRNCLIALILLLALSTALSTNRYISLFGALDRANGALTQVSYFLLFLCVATQIDSQRSKRLLNVIVLTAVPLSLLGLAQMAGWQPLPVFTDARTPMTTSLGRANFTGAYLALLLPLTLAIAQLETDSWRRIGYRMLFVLELAVIVLTQARAAWVAAIVGISVFLWLQVAPGWQHRVRWFTALGSSAALIGALLLILQRGVSAGGSIAARWTIWQASLSLLWSRLWLGYGADTLELHFPSVYPPELVYYQGRGVVVDRAHNWLLDWSLSYGIVATFVFVGLVTLILRQGWRQLTASENDRKRLPSEQHHEQHDEHRWLAASMAAICAQLVGNFFLFEVAATAVVYWLLLGIVAASGTRSTSLPFSLSSQASKVVIVASVIILAWSTWQSNVRPLLADVHSWRGTQALRQGNSRVALGEYATALQHQPQRASYHVALALTAAESGNFLLADQSMRDAIALRPTDPVLHAQLAAIYGRAALESPSELARAIELAYHAYEKAISLAPTIGVTYRQYADFALRSGNGKSALIQAQRAVDLDATDGIAYGILGWTQLQNGDLVAARDAFEQAVKWRPDSADFHLGLATVYFQQGELDAARRAVQQSLMLDPTNPPALTLEVQLEK